MADSISCPHCHRVLQAPEDYHGREVRCPECQRTFIGGTQTDITAQAPLTPFSASEVQPGLPPSGTKPWPAGRHDEETADDEYDVRGRVAYRGEYRPAGGLALAVKVLLALGLLLSFVSLGSDYLQYILATRLVARVEVPMAELDSNDTRQQILGIIHLLNFIITAIVFVIWFHRAHANLEPLGTRNLTYTSGWAAGCWFVPIMNLFRPVQIAQEIWRHSAPSPTDGENVQIEASGNSALIGFWWGAWIISNVIGQITMRMTLAVNSPESLQAATVGSMVAEVASILAAALALAVVAAIDARQSARAEAL